jgi:hypothetical protein
MVSHCQGAAWRVGQDVRVTAARSGFDPGDDRRFFGTFLVAFPSQYRLSGAGVSRDGSCFRNSGCLRGFRGTDVPRPSVVRPSCHKRRRSRGAAVDARVLRPGILRPPCHKQRRRPGARALKSRVCEWSFSALGSYGRLGTKKGVPFGTQNCVGTKLSRYGF